MRSAAKEESHVTTTGGPQDAIVGWFHPVTD